MQSGWQFYSQEAVPPQRNQVGNGYMHLPVPHSTASVLPPDVQHLTPVHGIEFQPSEVCPKNFIIFDQTDHRSQIMYHPAIAHRLNVPGLSSYDPYIQENSENRYANVVEKEALSSGNNDSDDIDALLSLEEEEETDEKEDYDEEEVSTARTYGNYGSNSPDYCSTYQSKPQKNVASSSNQKSSSRCGSCSSEKKRQKMKKMVKALRGIVPGSDEMNTVTVLDEAVRYLKTLKVEVQKLGVTNFKN